MTAMLLMSSCLYTPARRLHSVFHTEYSGQNVSVKYNNNKHKTYNVIAWLHVLTLTESSSGPHDIDPYKECTMHCGILNTNNICSEYRG